MDKKYNNYFAKLEKLHNDNEFSHILQDKIYRQFIRDIVNNKFKNVEELNKIANKMNKYVVRNDKGRWYA
jgi:hypothetical protein